MPGNTSAITETGGGTARAGGSVVVYLPVGVRSRLRERAAATGRSHTQLVFDALNATHTRLADVLGGAAEAAGETDGIFLVQRSGRRRHREDQVQVSIRPHPANLAVIDDLAARHTTGNRSALIAAALDEFLPAALKGVSP
ncbi:hypothetical protein QLQ12_21020 [Actinoplanes sp. NEAU-A12]|uniref:Ribbon-helix-helix protein CopG domain-containing protein n=1 Tax=Actinoplanes sandaracinus TaxID=3045177 RepID=A0ABT6WN00_9ACTN|nr:hypothetical protein [Actinoplanes sandaracinus]MDI6101099.1 hypothetical protein [Actinoplanes sandaracinus]